MVSIKLLQPFPEAELVAALKGKKAVTVLERSDVTALTSFVTQALYRAAENAAGVRHPGIPAIDALPHITTAIFGLGAHDLQPRHLVAAFKNMEKPAARRWSISARSSSPRTPSPRLAELQAKLKAAYPETELMALETEANPHLLPASAFRVRFHSVGGYGTIATGKLLTDILAGVLDLRSKAAPKYGSEKSGAPTNYYITLSPEPVKITNAELEDVEIVISPDHKVFSHTNPLKGLAEGGTFILQSNLPPLEAWRELPAHARKTIRDKRLNFFVIDAFAVAKRHAPTHELETRMMGIAFIGAVCGHVDRVAAGAARGRDPGENPPADRQEVRRQGRQDRRRQHGGDPRRPGGDAEGQLHRSGLRRRRHAGAKPRPARAASRFRPACAGRQRQGGQLRFLDQEYYDDIIASHFRDGTIAEAPVLPGTGMFMPAGSAAWKDKGLFRRNVPEFNAGPVHRLPGMRARLPGRRHSQHGARHSTTCWLTALPMLDLTEARRDAVRAAIPALSDAVREAYRKVKKGAKAVPREVAEVGARSGRRQCRAGAPISPSCAKRWRCSRSPRPSRSSTTSRSAEPGSGGLYAVNIDPWKCTRLPGMHRRLRPRRAGGTRADAGTSGGHAGALRIPEPRARTRRRASMKARRPADGETKRLILDREATTTPSRAGMAPAAAAAR